MENSRIKPDIREKTLAYGISYPVDEELVMMILGSGTRNLSVEKLSRQIVAALNSSNDGEIVQSLLRLKGVGQGKALAVAAALELGRRRSMHLGQRVKHPSDILPFVQHYGMCEREHFLSVSLTGGLNIIKIHVVSVGTLSRTIVHPREVFREAIKDNASAVIFCHNHPSGSLEPSIEDMEATRELLDAASVLGISVLDHLIISSESYFSFLEHRLLFVPKE